MARKSTTSGVICNGVYDVSPITDYFDRNRVKRMFDYAIKFPDEIEWCLTIINIVRRDALLDEWNMIAFTNHLNIYKGKLAGHDSGLTYEEEL